MKNSEIEKERKGDKEIKKNKEKLRKRERKNERKDKKNKKKDMRIRMMKKVCACEIL